jgi:probable HAF family extracellular repeat protein
MAAIWGSNPNDEGATRLGDFGYGHLGSSMASSINNNGKVVGYATYSDGLPRACFWPAVGVINSIGTLKHDSYALAINDSDWIVGISTFRAFLWTPDYWMQDLNVLVVNLPPGVKLLSANAINNNGQIAGYNNNGRSYRLIPDTQPPTGSITLNGGAGYSSTLSVTLGLSASDPEVAPGIAGSGVGWMRFSDHPEGGQDVWSWWYPYNPSMTWTFNSGGTRYVKAQFMDKAGHESAVVQANIEVNTIPPTGNININNGAAATNSPNATLNLSYSADTTHMRFNTQAVYYKGLWMYEWGSWQPVQPTVSWTMAEEGPNFKMVQFRNGSGNTSPAYKAEIILDTAGPTGVSVKINNGETSTKSPTVTLTVAGTDATTAVAQMRFSDHQVYRLHQWFDEWTDWEPYTPTNPADPNPIVTKNWTFSGDGAKYVKAQVRDQMGNLSTIVQADIMVDSAPPTDGTLKATPGRDTMTLDCSGFSDSGSGIAYYVVYGSLIGFPSASGRAYTVGESPLLMTDLSPGTTYYLRVVAIDEAGNVSPGATLKATTLGNPLPHLLLLLGD